MDQGHNHFRLVSLAALWSSALFVLPWWLPLPGAVPSLASPLPLLLAYRRGGVKAGRQATVAATLLALLVSAWGAGTLLGGFFFLYHAALGTALGEAWRKDEQPAGGMAAAALAGFLTAAGLVAAMCVISGLPPMELADRQMVGQMTLVAKLHQAGGLDSAQAAQLQLRLLDWGRVLVRLSPGLVLAGSLLLAWLNWLGARRLTRAADGRQGGQAAGEDQTVRYSGLALFKAPETLVWPLIAAAAATAFAKGWLFWLGGNLLVVLGFIYFLQGVAIASFWLNKKGAPTPVKAVLYVLLAVEFYAAVVVAGVGLFDLWFDFRRLGRDEGETP